MAFLALCFTLQLVYSIFPHLFDPLTSNKESYELKQKVSKYHSTHPV